MTHGTGRSVEADMITTIFHYVQDHGELTNQAQSDWGQDRYEYNGITVGLGDAGYTKMVRWGDRLHVWWMCGNKPKFERGNTVELTKLYEGIQSVSSLDE